MKFDYGPMKTHEANALKGDLFTSGKDNISKGEEAAENPKGKVIDLVLPILILIAVCIVALVYNGNGNSFAGMNFVTAFSNTDATVGLPWGALITIVIAIIYFAIRKVVKIKDSLAAIPDGFKAMVPAILILTMATALKNMTGLLGAKVFVAQLMSGAASGLSSFLPAIIFLVAVGLSFATGTSWGTFGILIPIVTAIFANDPKLMIIGMSACLAGAVCGDHCSPISDTTIMSSAGAQCNHINHVSTQLPYALTVAGVSFVNFIIAPFLPIYVVLPISIVMMVGVIVAIKFISGGKKAKA